MCTFMIIFRAKIVEKIKLHILFFNNPPPPENRVIYEIMWKSIVQPDRPQVTALHAG